MGRALSITERFLDLLGLQKKGVANRYEGATWSSKRSMLPGQVQSARLDISSYTRMELVRKSRYFEKNNPIYNRIADLWELYISGQGLAVSPNSSSMDWNATALRSFETWCRFCDFTGRQNFGTIIGLWARAWFVDGEVFVLLTRGETGRPRLQTIEAHLVSTPDKLAGEEGRTIIDGVQIESSGRPLTYWVQVDSDRREWRPIDRENIIHIFEPSRPGQYRGIPICHSVINELHDLDDLHILEMQAAKDNARVSRFVMTGGAEATDEDILRTGETTGDDGKKRQQYYDEVVGAEARMLYPGDKVMQFASERPSVVTREYWRYKTELVCTGVGIPYVMVFPDSMQGTVYRGSLDMATAFFKARFAVISEAVKRAYTFWYLWASRNEPALRGAPSDGDQCTIAPPRAPNVDVGRNSSAMLAELSACATDYELIYGPLGLNWRERFRKLKEQQDYAASIGLKLPTAPRPTPPTA